MFWMENVAATKSKRLKKSEKWSRMNLYQVRRAGALYKLDSPYVEVTSGRVLKLVEHSA